MGNNNKSYSKPQLEDFWVDAIKNDDLIAVRYYNMYGNYNILFHYIFRYNAIKIYEEISSMENSNIRESEEKMKMRLNAYLDNCLNMDYNFSLEMCKSIYDVKKDDKDIIERIIDISIKTNDIKLLRSIDDIGGDIIRNRRIQGSRNKLYNNVEITIISRHIWYSVEKKLIMSSSS